MAPPVPQPMHCARADAVLAQRVIDGLRPHVTPERFDRLSSALRTRSRAVALVLDGVGNAHNAAAIFRTAEAFGFFEVHFIERVFARPRVNQAIDRGAHKWLDLRRHPVPGSAVDDLKARGYTVWASALRGDAVPIHEIPLDRPAALVFGNERDGVSPDLLDRADGTFRIPMAGLVESFNVSVAAAVSCYDLHMRRRAAQLSPGLGDEDARRVLAAWLSASIERSELILARLGLPVMTLGQKLPMLEE